jgi:DNA helicase HerA-like ATPase
MPKQVHLGLTLEHVLAIVGKRGSGKSFTLGSFLESLAAQNEETSIGHTAKQRAALLFDTLNIFQWMTAPVSDETTTSRHVLEQERLLRNWGIAATELDIDLWVPAGYGDRVTTRARPFQIKASDMEVADWAALLRVDAVQDIIGQLLTQLFHKVTRQGWGTRDGEPISPNPAYEIDDLLRCLREDQEIEHDFAPETRRALRQRLTAYLASPLFGPAGTSLAELLQPGRLSVLLLSGVPDDVRLVAVFLTIRKLLFDRARASEAAKSLELGFADDAEERARIDMTLQTAPPKTWVVIDEAQNVFPSERQTAASEILLRFVREGRNFGLSLAFTTQQPSAIDARIMAQVDTLIAHTLTVQKDLQNILANQKSREPTRIQLRGVDIGLADAIRQLGVGQAYVSNTDAERGLFMDVRPRVSVHGGFEG